jgi:two-component system, NtrC family, sensor kinase
MGITTENPIHVLHVDDEAGFLRVIREYLELKGPFQVDAALSVDEALEKMKKNPYDAVVSDYRMPIKDGLQFLKQLREEGNTIPFIILTGKGMEEVAAQALNLGADHYINKSEKPELLLSEIAHELIKAVERKRTYLAACLRQEKLKATLDSSPNAIMIIDQQGKIIECNLETVRLTRFSSKKEVIDKNILSFVEESDRQRILKSIQTALEKDSIKNVEFGLLTQIGRGLTVELSGGAIHDSAQKPTNIVVTLNDITERKYAEKKLRQYSKHLRENQRFLENIFASFPDAVTVCDLVGNIIRCNQATLDLHGYSSKNELIGVNLYALLVQGDYERARKELEKAIVLGSRQNIEFTMVRKGGDEFPGELSFGCITDSSHKSIGLVVLTKDITDRKLLQDQVIVSEKLAAVGRLAASFSHDIRNPLAVIKNSTYFLEMRLKESADEKVLKHLRILKEEINFANLMVNDLLDFTRKNPPHFEEADLNETVQFALSSVSVPENVKVTFRPGKLSKILLDQTQFQRILTNLFVNAFQAMPNGGNLTIQTTKNCDKTELSVTDTGVGMNQENIERLFTPFFTTKKNGVGLGLSICKQIIEAHGGELTVRSKLGHGSAFTVRLPIHLKETLEKQFSCKAIESVEVRNK